MSCAVMRTRLPSRRKLPSSTFATFNFCPISLTSAFLPLNANDDVRATTRSPSTFASAFQPFGRHLECPGDDERDRESERYDNDESLNDPFGRMESWQDGGGDLYGEPTNDRIRYCDLVNITPFQLGKEVAFVHGLSA